MHTDFLNEAQAIQEELIAIRRDIHAHPEPGNQEFRTSGIIQAYLKDLGIEVEQMLDTAVVGTLRGAHSGKTVAFRADMDALPVEEQTGLPFASCEKGRMHACGHDVHVTALLGAAKLLAAHRDELHGNVKFFFEPDEETWGGARRMMEAGCMENPHVDAVFGAHVDPNLDSGKIAVKYGNHYATSDIFTAIVHGVSTHGAEPHNGIDPIVVGAQIVLALQTIPSRRMPPAVPCVLTIGEFHAGNRFSIIGDTAKIVGQFRTYGVENRDKMNKLVPEVIHGVAEANGATVDLDMIYGYSGVVNHAETTDIVVSAVKEVLGEKSLVVYQDPTLLTEDFGYFIEKTPGTFYHIGVRNPELGAVHPLHSGLFRVDEAAIAKASAVHAQVMWDFLHAE